MRVDMHGVENSSRKVWRGRPLGIPSHRWECNIRMDLREIKMVCVYTHTHTCGHLVALLHVRVLTVSFLRRLCATPGCRLRDGRKRYHRCGMWDAISSADGAIGWCLSLLRLHDTTRDSHTRRLSIKTTVCVLLQYEHLIKEDVLAMRWMCRMKKVTRRKYWFHPCVNYGSERKSCCSQGTRLGRWTM
jgi:hypothetical protein